MKPQTNSLLSTLLKSLILPGLLAALVGGFIIYSLTKEEYENAGGILHHVSGEIVLSQMG